MRCLWLISLATIMLGGCISVKPGGITREAGRPAGDVLNAIRYQAPTTSHLFKATLDIKKHHLTGLLVIKRMDSLAPPVDTIQNGSGISVGTYRIVFVNEVGMTFFDFELSPTRLQVISCFASLNRKSLLNILETNFRMLTKNGSLDNEIYYRNKETNQVIVSGETGKYKVWNTYSDEGDTLQIVGAKSNMADPVIIAYEKYTYGAPRKISIENPFIGMKMSLRRLVK